MATHKRIGILFFILKSRINNKGKAPLWCRLTIDSKRINISTGEAVDPNSWDSKRQRLRSKGEEAKHIERLILRMTTKFRDHYDDAENEQEIISLENIKARYNGLHKKHYGLIEIAEIFLGNIKSELGKTYEWGTVKNYVTSVKFLKEFVLKKFGVTDINIKQVERSFIIQYKQFVTSTEREKTCNQNGFAKHFQRIKTIIGFAINNLFLDRDPFAGHHEKTNEVKNIYLNDAELDKLRYTIIQDDALAKTRDIFLFCCYTGLSFSDMLGLRKDDIILHIDNRKWILIKRKKTKTDCKIPLLNVASAFLDEYMRKNSPDFDHTIFPQITNQHYNRNLKEVFSLCEINKVITSHKARHTFATTICANNGVPIDTCAEILGHRSLRITKKYYQTTPIKLGNDINELEKKLHEKVSKSADIHTSFIP